MEVTPTFLDRQAARQAVALMSLLRQGGLSPSQDRVVRMALRYYVARWDLIPDLVPGIGMIDDWLLLYLLARALGASAGPSAREVDALAVQRQVAELLGQVDKGV